VLPWRIVTPGNDCAAVTPPGAVNAVVSTTMIGDYYSGARRERFMSLQTTVSASSAFFSTPWAA
jgi:hypothetical protein